MGCASPTELLIVLAIVLLLFGATRLPQLFGALGSSVRNFKKGLSDADQVDGKSADAIEAHEVDQLEDGKKKKKKAKKKAKKVVEAEIDDDDEEEEA